MGEIMTETLTEILQLRLKPSTMSALTQAAEYRQRTVSGLTRVLIERFLDSLSQDDIFTLWWGGSLTPKEASILFAKAAERQLYPSPAPGGNGGDGKETA